MAIYDATTKNGDCIFCKIVSNEVHTPGIFWEDAEYMAFLSIDPNTEGFSCVIPKQHFSSDVLKMSDEALQKFILAAKKVSQVLENHFDDVGRVGLIIEGTGIDHAHIKLVPMHNTPDLKNGKWRQYLSEKEFWFDSYEGWISSGGGPMADRVRLEALAKNLKESQK